MNKLILIIFYVFYLKKRIFNTYLIAALLIPSLILYSSLFLRDILIALSTTIILIEVFRFKLIKLPLIIIFLVILVFIKPQNAIILLIFLSIVGLSRFFKESFLSFTFILIGVFILGFIFQNIILTTINFYVYAFALESGASHDDLELYFEYQSILNLYISLIPNFIKAMFVPFPWTASGPLQFLQSLENIFLVCISLIIGRKILSMDLIKSRFNFLYLTIFFLGIGMAMYGTIIFNEGSLVRYKFSVIIPYIFAALAILYAKPKSSKL